MKIKNIKFIAVFLCLAFNVNAASAEKVTLTTTKNTGKIVNDILYLPVIKNNETGYLKATTVKEFKSTENLVVTGQLKTINPRVIGGSTVGSGSGLNSTQFIYTSTYGYANWVNPAPTWMGNAIIGACNNPDSTTSTCPTDSSGYMTGDTAHFFEFYCGVTLINEAWVMTAAHCLEGLKDGDGNALTVAFASVQVDDTSYSTDSNGLKVYMSGSGNMHSSQAYRSYVDMFIVNPNFDGNNVAAGNDIALMRLTNPKYPELYDIPPTPVVLPTTASTASSFAVGAEQPVYGWGVTDSTLNVNTVTSTDLSNQLVMGTVPFVSLDTNTKIIWSGADGQDTCTGDSGGPLMSNGVQVGITSYGTTDYCGTGAAAAYTDVGAFYNWIRTSVNENAMAVTSCFAGADCYINGILIPTDTTTDPTDTTSGATGTGGGTTSGATDTGGTGINTGTDTSTDSGSSSGGGGLGGIELFAMGCLVLLRKSGMFK